MIVTGVFLAMQYTPNAEMAFSSVDRITREVNFGWLIRTLHANGSSMFFLVVYIHIFRGMYYGSYKRPRELLWLFGAAIYLLMMATAFLGYTLPWGQMSFWGATVITNFFTAIPWVGKAITTWLWGGFSVANPDPQPVLRAALPAAVRHRGGGLPACLGAARDRVEQPARHRAEERQGHAALPSVLHDEGPVRAVGVFLILYAVIVVFYIPDYLGDPDNFVKANPLKTPPSIEPEWYFLPFYAILRSVPNKLLGVILMFGAVVMLFLMPWLDTSKVQKRQVPPLVSNGVSGSSSPMRCYSASSGRSTPRGSWILLGRVVEHFITFGFFLILLPFLGWFEKTLPLPVSISESVLGGGRLANTAIAAKPMEKA